MMRLIISVIVLSSFLNQLKCSGDKLDPQQQQQTVQDDIINIGLIVNMVSPVGEVVLTCIKMAISDSNALYKQNGTQFVLHTRDTKGEPFTAITAATDLIETIKVKAIIVPDMTSEALMMATLGDKANVPILSFTSISSSSTQHPYFLQIADDENTQFNGIIAFLEKFEWKNVAFVYEDTDDGINNVLPHLLEEFQERNIHVIYKNANSFSGGGDHKLIEELTNLKEMRISVFIIHTSPSLASRIFTNSKKLQMISEGYAWLITSKTMNFFDSLDPLVRESMQGALGLRSYIPASTNLQNFKLRMRRNEVHQHLKPNQEPRYLNVIGLRVYDTIWAMANTALSVGPTVSSNGSKFLNKLLESEFTGLSGDLRFMNGKFVVKGYEVVNVIGKLGEREVGFWTLDNGFTKEIPLVNNGRGLETIIWPGLTTNTPKGGLILSGKILRVGIPVSSKFGEFTSVMPSNKFQTNVTFGGLSLDVFNAAIEILGYDVPYELIPFPGTVNYNDLIYLVYMKAFDVAVGDITITPNRSLYVDFTVPYTDLGVGVVVPVRKKNMWFFLTPFDSELRFVVAIFFILVGIIVWLFEHPINKEFQGSRAQQIGTFLSFSASTLVYAHRERLKSNLSKFVVSVWLFLLFILASSYTAILSSILTVEQIQLANGGSIGYQDGSFERGEVVNNLNFSLSPYSSMDDYYDALSKGSEHGGVGAIVDEIPYIKIFLARYPSKYVMIETIANTNGFGFAFTKGSPLMPEISRAIMKLRVNGKLLELENLWYNHRKTDKSSFPNPQNYGQPEPRTLILDDFLGLFLVSGLAKTTALLLFLIFFLHKRISLNHQYFRIIVAGKLAFMMKYFYPTMVNGIVASHPDSLR